MNTNTNNTNTYTNVSRDVMIENLDLHIPRISANTTAKHIADALWYMRIATVDYVDIVAIKDPETKEIKHFSAFLRLRSWGPERFPAAEFNEKKTFKIVLGGYANDPYEKYWVLYPNTNPLPRSKVNTHQLAASTEKLFEINEQLVAKIEMMETKFALMQQQMGIMEERLTRLTYVEPTPEEKKELTKLPELFRYGHPRKNQRYESYDMPFSDGGFGILKRVDGVVVVDEDDCMFSKRLTPFQEELIPDAHFNPVQIIEQDPVDEEEVKVLIASNGRAVCSRDFCGNI
jgi:hypothetical protein